MDYERNFERYQNFHALNLQEFYSISGRDSLVIYLIYLNFLSI